MASSSSKMIVIDEDDDGQKRIMTSLDSMGTSSECKDSEKQDTGSWSLFHFLKCLSCSAASFSKPSTPLPSSSSSWYYSARIQRMIEKRGEFRTEVESEIAASKATWSQVDPAMSQTEPSGETNRRYFEVLKRRRCVRHGDQIVFQQIPEEDELRGHWSLFNKGSWLDDHLVVYEKLAEGGQAELHECCIGVVGTGFWRAHGILQQLKDKVPMSKVKFREKCHLYSFDMTCYELETGRIPFEDHCTNNYDIVLNGDRLELLLDLEPLINGIFISCWHVIPSGRPSFEDIVKNCREIVKKFDEAEVEERK